jgi:hypothetical protein
VQGLCHTVEKYGVLVKRKRGPELAYLLREFLQQGVPKLSPDEGSICLDYDPMGAAVVNDDLLLTEGVELV